MIDLSRWFVESQLQWLPTIMARIVDRDFDQTCIDLAKKYGLTSYARPLFMDGDDGKKEGRGRRRGADLGVRG